MQVWKKLVVWSLIIFIFLLDFPIISSLNHSEASSENQIGNKNQSAESVQEPSFITAPLGNEPVTFDNVSDNSNILNLRSDSFAWGDYNNDGYLDFLARGNLTIGTRLFKNNGPPNWNFTDMTETLNLTGSGPKPNRGYPIWGDYNNNGYLDFFVAGDSDQLWKNNGPPAWNFTNVTIEAGNMNDGRPSEAAAWGDYNRDGFIDLYVVSWRDAQNIKYRDILWHNNGDGTFTDMSTSAGIYSSTTPNYEPPPFAGMGVAWGDYNNDGWPDIYVCNYLITPNYLWRNNHDGTFTDVAMEQHVAGKPDIYNSQGPYYGHTAGAGWADFNNNGDLDLWVSNLAHKDSEASGGLGRGYFCDDSMMYLNNGGPFFEFEDIRNRTGIPITPVGTVYESQWKDEDYFGVTWGDFDNDGDIDFWVPQVKTYHSWAQSYLWQNNDNETFTDVSDAVGMKVWSNTGATWADYNNDGYLDLLTEGAYPYQGPREARLFQNNGNSNNWLHLRLTGVQSNTAAIGARVYMTSGSLTQTREIGGDAGGHAFQNSFMVEFGLGSNNKADEVKVIWPSGIVQVLKNVNANQILNISENILGLRIDNAIASDYEVNEDEIIDFDAAIVGTPNKYQWDFDNDGIIDWDSTLGSPQTQYNYTRSGNYTAKLWVWDSTQSLGFVAATDFIRVNNLAPIVDAGADLEVWEDQAVDFNINELIDTPSDLNNIEYNWSFGDGKFSGWQIEPGIQYSYPLRGVYNVMVMVRDDDNDINSDNLLVEVRNKPPSCTIIHQPTGVEDSPVSFSVIYEDTVSDLTFIIFQLDFGDGNNSEWTNVTTIEHTFQQSGSYIVRCTIHDDDGIRDENFTQVFIVIYNIEPECIVEKDKTVYEDQTVFLNGSGNDTISDISSLSYVWDYGDGTTSSKLYHGMQNTSHVYTKSDEYQAKLIVSDNDGVECSKVINVTVINVKPKCTAMEDVQIFEDDTVQFTGAGWDSESDIETLKYSWYFGILDLPVTFWNASPDFEFKYVDEGEYTAVLTVCDDDGATGIASVKVRVLNVEPNAKFLTSATDVSEDQVVDFNALQTIDTASDLETLEYTWDFGDKSPKKTGSTQTHTYPKKGEYRVSLIVTDDNGDSDSIKKTIKVKNIAPTARISLATEDIYEGTEFIFSGADSRDTSSDRKNLTFDWDFGDNSKNTGEVVTHSFHSSGKLKIKLTVTDDDSSSGEAEVTITVKEFPGEKQETESEEMDSKTIISAGIVTILIIILLVILLLYFIKPKSSETTEEPEITEKQPSITEKLPETEKDEIDEPDNDDLENDDVRPDELEIEEKNDYIEE